MTHLRLVLAVTLALGCSGGRVLPRSAESPVLGHALPSFRRPALDGTFVDSAKLRGRTVVVKFFADYCEPCKRTLPALERLHRARPDVAFIGVSEDEFASTAASVGALYGLTFPLVHDQALALKGRFRVTALPATFVADAQGVVRWVGGPEQREEDLAGAVDTIAP
jgi:thiol-disulfide isomerase/thioredoxin